MLSLLRIIAYQLLFGALLRSCRTPIMFWYLVIFVLTTLAIVAVAILVKKLKEDHLGRLKKITSLKPHVESALSELNSLYSSNHYLTESERVGLDKKYESLYKGVSDIIKTKELKESPSKDLFLRYFSAVNDSAGNKRFNNQRFIEKQLSNHKDYFDSVLTYPLDVQQREAIVSLEDNVLVISSAGSGKTMTTVGKVHYLIDKQGVPANKILLITYTRKAADSLSKRIGIDNLACRTFHKLALDIIGSATGKKPSITGTDFPAQVYHRLFDNNPDFKTAISDYILNARYAMKDQFEYASRQEYLEDRQKYGVLAYFGDMRGRPVFCKSDEECRIADFLGSRGIRFLYEEPYEVSTQDSEHRQYRPDFSLYFNLPDGKTKRIYLEHFAINEAGNCPPWFSSEDSDKYKEGIVWKRNLHKRQGTILLETSSGDFHHGDVFLKLSQQLRDLGVVFSKSTPQSISRELPRQEESILSMLTSFTFLLKSRNRTIDDIKKRVHRGPDSNTLNDIITPFVETYAQLEQERNEIDFTDAIIWATHLCNNGHRPDYDYILVDEFQDISMDRYRFLQSLRRVSPLTKLFCVGDDWQSIYRFAGSDMALFKQFEKFFGYTKKCLMETTYRFGEPTIAESSKFILTNPEQAVKKVHPFHTDAETSLSFLPTNDKTDIVDTIKALLDQIPQDKEVIIIGRYSFDISIFKDTDFIIHDSKELPYLSLGKRKINYLTIHKSKGLESDYVILINCNGGTMGFPSQISDSPILKYVLSEPDAYEYSEERRVFYVGITRAKKQTWVLYDKKNPSVFVKEFVKDLESDKNTVASIPESERCPRCRCGRVKVDHSGIATNGNPFSVLVCTNEKLGCDYREYRFINLNSRSRTRH